jgi:hypothetical protein
VRTSIVMLEMIARRNSAPDARTMKSNACHSTPVQHDLNKYFGRVGRHGSVVAEGYEGRVPMCDGIQVPSLGGEQLSCVRPPRRFGVVRLTGPLSGRDEAPSSSIRPGSIARRPVCRGSRDGCRSMSEQLVTQSWLCIGEDIELPACPPPAHGAFRAGRHRRGHGVEREGQAQARPFTSPRQGYP